MVLHARTFSIACQAYKQALWRVISVKITPVPLLYEVGRRLNEFGCRLNEVDRKVNEVGRKVNVVGRTFNEVGLTFVVGDTFNEVGRTYMSSCLELDPNIF